MEMRKKNFIRRFLICFLFSLPITFSWNQSYASNKAIELKSANISKILSALENKMEGPELREKIKNKLSILEDKQILLIASLSERIEGENHTAGAEIALLLITALIVFS